MCAPDAPPPPDYRGAAEEQGEANLEAAVANSILSNPNVINPYGSRTVTYDYGEPSTPPPSQVFFGGFPGFEAAPFVMPSGNTGGGITNLDGISIPTVTIEENLSPVGQSLFDTENRVRQDLLDTAESGLNRVSDAMDTPFDISGLPTPQSDITGTLPDVNRLTADGLQNINTINIDQLPDRTVMPTVAGNEAVVQALIERSRPFFDQRRSQTEADLLARGFNPGGEGYDARIDDLNRSENDMRLAAILRGGEEQSRLFALESMLRQQGLTEQQARQSAQQSLRAQQFGERSAVSDFDRLLRAQLFGENQEQLAADASERQRQIQEQAYLRQLPLSEINALRTGNQPVLPQFQPYQGANVAPAPLFDATLAGGNFAQQNYQNQVAGSGGLFDLGGSLLGAAGAANGFGNLFSLAGPAAAASDRRFKENIVPVGNAGGLMLYLFNYIGNGIKYLGYMADEVKERYPHDVINVNGYNYVTERFAPVRI